MAYSWDIKQCYKLWQDIENFIDSGGSDSYFFWTIINCQEDDTKLSLIDIQQRTTTFILLLDSDIISAKLYSDSGEGREGFNKKWSEFKK